MSLEREGGRVEHRAADFADPQAPADLVSSTYQAFGRLDVVVANHARSSGQSLERLTASEIDLTYAVNTRATLLLVQAFAARYDGRPGGRVVLFTSGQYHGAMPGELPYIASKAALRELTASLAVHLMRRGITVNCINPGPNDTGWASPEMIAEGRDRVPGGRWSTPRRHRPSCRLVGERRGRLGHRPGHSFRRWVVGALTAAVSPHSPDRRPAAMTRAITGRRDHRQATLAIG